VSSKSPHSPGFEYRPPSSHTSATSSILFSSAKPQSVAKRANPLGFDFGLADAQAPQLPPSPTSTVYEGIDSPTVPDFLLTGDESATVDLVRNHLRRPSTAHTQVAPNFHEDQYPVHRRKRSKDSWTAKTQTVFQVEETDRSSDFWDDHSGVFSYYGEAAPNDGIDEEEQITTGDEWTQDRQIEHQTPKSFQKSTNSSKSTSPKTPKASGRSPFDDANTSTAPLNVMTNVTVLRSTTSPIQQRSADSRDSNESMVLSSLPYKLPSSTQHQPVETMGYAGGYEVASLRQTMSKQSSTSTKRSQGSLSDRSSRSRSSDTRSPGGPAIRTDPRYITPEMPPAVFPNTPPLSVSPHQDGLATKVNISQQPDQSLTPPKSNNERKPPTQNVIKALKDRAISEPQLISMTATVPTVPIIRMGDDRLEQFRNERRKTRMTSKTSTPDRKTRRPMLDDEVDDHVTSPPPFTRQKRSSPPGVATRGPSRRRETTAGSVLFDDQLRERVPSPPSSKLLAGPEYTVHLPSPHMMADNPYQQGSQRPRHRRKVSRQEIDPVITHSSPALLDQWDGHPKRRMNGPIDPAW
jgi:hypothetical protein